MCVNRAILYVVFGNWASSVSIRGRFRIAGGPILKQSEMKPAHVAAALHVLDAQRALLEAMECDGDDVDDSCDAGDAPRPAFRPRNTPRTNFLSTQWRVLSTQPDVSDEPHEVVA